MKNFIKENWFKICFLVLLIIILITLKSELKNNYSLERKCTERADFFYKQGDYANQDGFSSFYINHWNKKLEKCFIEITTTSLNSNGFESIDVFDAFEGKHYGSFIGHSNCDPLSLKVINQPKRCQLDSGNIWFDGNDAKNSSDYHVGFGGLLNGGIGDENTLKEFLVHIENYMNN